MNNKLFDLLNQLNAIQILLERDGNEMNVCFDNDEKVKLIQKEVDALSAKEVEVLKALRKELLCKEEPKEKESKPKNPKREIVIRSNARKK